MTTVNQADRIREMLKLVSYKPGWKIQVKQDPNWNRVVIIITYATHAKLGEGVDRVYFDDHRSEFIRRRLIGSVRKLPEGFDQFKYAYSVDEWSLQTMSDEVIIEHVVAKALREAEMYEFEHWFRVNENKFFERSR